MDTHKNRLGTRLISLFLALMLSLSLFGLPVFAEGETTDGGGTGDGTVSGGDQSSEHGGTGGDSHAGIGAYGEGGWKTEQQGFRLYIVDKKEHYLEVIGYTQWLFILPCFRSA